jgi:hypothetical protein
MTFTPIKIQDYVKLHLKSNPGTKAAELIAQLQSALDYYKAGRRCTQCGAPIWVLGASQVGLMCFTCITGEADPSSDYEIDEACDKLNAPLRRKAR